MRSIRSEYEKDHQPGEMEIDMADPRIRLGDKTSHGGTVLIAGRQATIDNL
jgi:uncharacterized Zn-binding protein involved in type VI secretion